MPQGDDAANSGIAVKQHTYKRKRENVRRSGARGTGGLAAQINPNFLKSLPSMTRDIEQLTAGKLLQSGQTLRLNDIREIGKQEVKAKGIKRKRANPITELLSKGKNVRGIKGEFDASELAELDPELKSLMDHRKATSGGGGDAKRKRDGGGSGANAAAAGAAGKGSMPAPSGGTEGGGKGGGRGRALALSAPLGEDATTRGVFATDAEVKASLGEEFLG